MKNSRKILLAHAGASVRLYLLLAFVILLSSIIFTSCSSTLKLNVLKPGAVYVPQTIQTIALVNRTKPKSKASNIVEGIFSGEGLFQDKSGVDNSLNGLMDALQNSPRFKTVMTDLYLPGSGAGVVFPNPLNWQEIEDICKKYNCDGVCTIETYDSDTRIIPSKNATRKKDSNGKEYDVIEFVAQQTVNVQLGFRLYDPATKSVIDQYHFTEQNNWTSKGTTEAQALNGLINKRSATDQVSYAAGKKYGIRIAPTWIWVSRLFYTRGGHDDMKKAGRLAKVNRWSEARTVWQSLQNMKAKTAGKAAHNIAISYEYEGDLQEAKKWASKAYTNFGNKRSRDYVRILEGRIADVQILEEQMKGVK